LKNVPEPSHSHDHHQIACLSRCERELNRRALVLDDGDPIVRHPFIHEKLRQQARYLPCLTASEILEVKADKTVEAGRHTPGQGCYYDDTYIFVGDTLFAGSIGRTDFPMSDPELMQASLSRLLELPGHLLVCSGHGPVTTLEQELQTNPFLDHVRRARGMTASGWSSAPGSRWG